MLFNLIVNIREFKIGTNIDKKEMKNCKTKLQIKKKKKMIMMKCKMKIYNKLKKIQNQELSCI